MIQDAVLERTRAGQWTNHLISEYESRLFKNGFSWRSFGIKLRDFFFHFFLIMQHVLKKNKLLPNVKKSPVSSPV